MFRVEERFQRSEPETSDHFPQKEKLLFLSHTHTEQTNKQTNNEADDITTHRRPNTTNTTFMWCDGITNETGAERSAKDHSKKFRAFAKER